MSTSTDFCMPSLGADMESGTLVEWLVQPGDVVHRGQIVAVVDTAKSAIEIEVFSDGVIDQIVVPVGQEVGVGTPIARLRGPEAAAEAVRAAPSAAAAPAEALAVPVPAAGSAPAGQHAPPVVRRLARELGVELARVAGAGAGGKITRRDVERAAAAVRPTAPAAAAPETPTAPAAASTGRRASPYARRLAAEQGVDLAAIAGSGPGGAVRAADLRPAPPTPEPGRPASPAPASAAASRLAGSKQQAMREAVGQLMARSKREIPHYYLASTIDLSAAMTWLRHRNGELPVAERLIPAALLLTATAAAAREYPDLDGHFVDGEFRPALRLRLGVPVALRGGGLVTPSIEDADQLSVTEMMARLRDLTLRGRAGRLRRDELADPTLTVTDLGELGVEAVFGVIYPPQVALVGFGSVVERPWAVGGMLTVRPLITATLSADHRASDGRRGARFLARIGELLQTPEEL